jgi:hypothetical protein
MIIRSCWVIAIWLLTFPSSFAAETWSISFTAIEPVVRSNIIWRATVTGIVPESLFDNGPYILQISLSQGDTILVNEAIPLRKLGQLVPGVQLALTTNPAKNSDLPIIAQVTVRDSQHHDSQLIQRELQTPLSIQRSLERLYKIALARSSPLEPLPALWFEQAGELMLGSSNLQTCEALLSLEQQMTRWLANEASDSTLQAFRDPVDGSLQPWRIYLPITPPIRGVVLTLNSSETAPRKSAWPTLPPSWINAARSNQMAIIEVYSAGDRDWQGVGVTRAGTVLALAQQTIPALKNIPVIAFGIGRGAHGALALIEQSPQKFSALAFDHPIIALSEAPSLSPHLYWQALQHPGMRPTHVVGTPIIWSGGEDPGAVQWLARMRLTQTPIIDDAGSPQDAAFWQHLTNLPAVPPTKDWLVLNPGKYGRVVVEEMSEWGIAGTLSWRSPQELMTTGIARLRITDGGDVQVNGAPYIQVATKPISLPANSEPRKIFGQACGPAATYAQRPFTLVIGTGESAAALTDNRNLANAFTIAWIEHAHGRPPTVDDIHFKAEEQAGRHLVLIGNARSNRVLAELLKKCPTFPLQWTARELTCAGQTWLRSEHRPVVVSWPHPAHDGRMLVILDGSPRWQQPGLPLATVPDLAIGGLTADDENALWRDFSTAWR